MNNKRNFIIINKNIHCPASYYYCTPYIPDLAKEILAQINYCEKNTIMIESIDMNEPTYNWLFRLFSIFNSSEYETKPLTSTSEKKYLFDYPIKINKELSDGIIKFNTGNEYAME